MIARHLLWPIPVIVMTVAQICLVVLWACGANWVYFHVFPARKMLLVYGSHSATRLALKMSKRSDKYLICAAVNAELGYDEVIKQVDKFPAIVICDVKGSLRNQILKYCYGKSIRVYITPKLSDIIIGGSEEIHLFDTPLFLCRNSGLSLTSRWPSGRWISSAAFWLLLSQALLCSLPPPPSSFTMEGRCCLSRSG